MGQQNDMYCLVFKMLLLKGRKPLQTNYSKGVWSNPKPLHCICTCMGFVGLSLLLTSMTMPSACDDNSDIDNVAVTYWLGLFAGVLWIVSFFHGLRHEELLSISSMCDACLFATFAYQTAVLNDYSPKKDDNIFNKEGIDNDDDCGQNMVKMMHGKIFLCFAFIRSLILGFVLLDKTSLLVDVLSNAWMCIALYVGAVVATNNTASSVGGQEIIPCIVFLFTAAIVLYNATSELLNSTVQKVIIPVGPQISSTSLYKMFHSTKRKHIATKKKRVEKSRKMNNKKKKKATGVITERSYHFGMQVNKSCTGRDDFSCLESGSESTTNDESVTWNTSSRSDLMLVSNNAGDKKKKNKEKQRRVSFRSDTDLIPDCSNDDNDDHDHDIEEDGTKNTEEDESSNDCNYKYPGDTKLLGESDFQTPLFNMFLGLAIYSSLQSVGLATRSTSNTSGANGNINDDDMIMMIMSAEASIVNLLSQVATIVICMARGQTSYGFCSFTYVLESIILTNHLFDTPLKDNVPLLVGILLLQIVWIISSWKVFLPLSAITMLHCIGLLGIIVFLSSSSEAVTRAKNTSLVFFILMTTISSLTLALFLGCSKHIRWCKRWLEKIAIIVEGGHSNSDDAAERKLCDIGFAHDREQFDKCVKILREGGVCCIPTDTVYCLACAANKPDAIQRIYDIKNRPSEKPLSLWLGSMDDIKAVAPSGKGWGPKLISFMGKMWPGSVSLVVSRGDWLRRMGIGEAANLIGTPDSIALRVPNSTLTVSLLMETGPLAITSANPSGACDCTHHNKVDDKIASKIDFILADGSSPMTIASSVVDVRDIEENKLFFYRVGCVPEAYIWNKLRSLYYDGSGRSLCVANTPYSYATLSDSGLAPLQHLMKVICMLLNCDSWRIFTLQPPSLSEQDDPNNMKDQQEKEKVDCTGNLRRHMMTAVRPWESICKKDAHVADTFLTGICYYDADVSKDRSELVVPVYQENNGGKVCAVIELMNKRHENDGTIIPFQEKDKNALKLACHQIVEMMIEVKEDVVLTPTMKGGDEQLSSSSSCDFTIPSSTQVAIFPVVARFSVGRYLTKSTKGLFKDDDDDDDDIDIDDGGDDARIST